MKELEEKVTARKAEYEKVIYINCAAVVHTEHFYHVDRTFETNVIGMKSFGAGDPCRGRQLYQLFHIRGLFDGILERGRRKEDDFLLLATAEHSQRTSYATGKLLTEFL